MVQFLGLNWPGILFDGLLMVILSDLDVLATHPAHGGRGCAGRLVKWGMQRGDEEGLECYVEAQDTSKPIFVKYGWKEVRELVVQGEKRGTILLYTPEKTRD